MDLICKKSVCLPLKHEYRVEIQVWGTLVIHLAVTHTHRAEGLNPRAYGVPKVCSFSFNSQHYTAADFTD